MAGRHHKDPGQTGAFLQIPRATSGSPPDHKSQGARKHNPITHIPPQKLPSFYHSNNFTECAKNSRKLLWGSVSLSFMKWAPKTPSLRFHESKSLLSLPYTEGFLRLTRTSGLNPKALGADQLLRWCLETHPQDTTLNKIFKMKSLMLLHGFPNNAQNQDMQTSEVNNLEVIPSFCFSVNQSSTFLLPLGLSWWAPYKAVQ